MLTIICVLHAQYDTYVILNHDFNIHLANSAAMRSVHISQII